MFLVLTLFSGRGQACGNQTDTIPSPCVNHNEQAAGSVFAKSDPTVFLL